MFALCFSSSQFISNVCPPSNSLITLDKAPQLRPFQYFKFLFTLSTASITFLRWPKSDSRKSPSPLGPKPGMPTTLHSILRLSKREDFMFAPAETVLESTQKVNEALL